MTYARLTSNLFSAPRRAVLARRGAGSLLAALLVGVVGAPATTVAGTGPLPTPPGAAHSAATWDYYYAGAATQQLTQDYASGVTATFQVEHPKQVENGHSLAEVAVESPDMDRSYIEAGWIVTPKTKPQLFIFWWDQNVPKCYNQGCGWVAKGPGIQPGSTLTPHTSLTLTWQQKHGKWWLLVDGKRSGYYPDSQWTKDFSSTGFAQVFGEIANRDGKPVCADMGNGKPSDKAKAASITDVGFLDGPDVNLVYNIDDPDHNYTLDLTGPTSMRYGGPGLC